MQLYTYFRSSAAYRVRIALNLKGLPYKAEFVNLLKDQNLNEAYRAIHPQSMVPALIDQHQTLIQSLAILEYLDEKYPLPALLPSNVFDRAIARSYALQVVSDIHPLQNRRVLKYLEGTLNLSDLQREEWLQHWIVTGLTTLEAQVRETAGKFMIGNEITIADICLVPQIYSALRFEVGISTFPKLMEIYSRCMDIKAILEASPENQPDWAG